MYNLAALLEDSARSYPARDAVVLGAARLTYAEVDAAATGWRACSSSGAWPPATRWR